MKEDIGFTQAAGLAADSVIKTFKMSGCSQKCLMDQLEDYYSGLCSSLSGSMPLKDPKGGTTYGMPKDAPDTEQKGDAG